MKNKNILMSMIGLAVMSASFIACTMDEEAVPVEEISEELVKEEMLEDKEARQNFELNFSIEKEGKQNYLITELILEEDSWVASPKSEDGMLGKIDFSSQDSTLLTFEGDISEDPESIEEYDEVIEENVRRVEGTTLFRQYITPHQRADFKVFCVMFMVVEPSCLPWEIEFKITQTNGELSVEKMNTTMTYEGY